MDALREMRSPGPLPQDRGTESEGRIPVRADDEEIPVETMLAKFIHGVHRDFQEWLQDPYPKPAMGHPEQGAA